MVPQHSGQYNLDCHCTCYGLAFIFAKWSCFARCSSYLFFFFFFTIWTIYPRMTLRSKSDTTIYITNFKITISGLIKIYSCKPNLVILVMFYQKLSHGQALTYRQIDGQTQVTIPLGHRSRASKIVFNYSPKRDEL